MTDRSFTHALRLLPRRQPTNINNSHPDADSTRQNLSNISSISAGQQPRRANPSSWLTTGRSVASSINIRSVDSTAADARTMVVASDEVWVANKDGSISIFSADSVGDEKCRIPSNVIDGFINVMVAVGDAVWAGGQDGHIRVFSRPQKALVRQVSSIATAPSHGRSPDEVLSMLVCGEQLLVGAVDGSITLWSLDRMEICGSLEPNHSSGVLSLLFQDNVLYSGDDGGNVWIWDIVAKRRVHTLRLHDQGVSAMAKTETGHLWTASKNGVITVTALQSYPHPTEIRVIREHKGRINQLVSLGDRVLSGSIDCILCLWDSTSFALLGKFTEHRGFISGLCWVSKRVCWRVWSASNDGSIRVIDVDGSTVRPSLRHGAGEGTNIGQERWDKGRFELLLLELVDSQQQVGSLATALDASQKEVGVLNQKLAELTTLSESKDQQLLGAGEAAKVQQASHACELTKLNTELSAKVTQIGTLNSQLADLQSRYEALENKLTACQKDLLDKEVKLSISQSQVSEINETVNEVVFKALNSSDVVAGENVSELRAKIAAQEVEIASLQAALHESCCHAEAEVQTDVYTSFVAGAPSVDCMNQEVQVEASILASAEKSKKKRRGSKTPRGIISSNNSHPLPSSSSHPAPSTNNKRHSVPRIVGAPFPSTSAPSSKTPRSLPVPVPAKPVAAANARTPVIRPPGNIRPAKRNPAMDPV